MNYFAHARPFLDRPYYAAGTGVPDWLTVVDRAVRVRSRNAAALVDDPDETTAEVARGALQHLRDDARFHETRAFAETMFALTAQVRQRLGADGGFRTAFLGHLLVEVLLDALLVAENPSEVETYYRVLETVDAEHVQAAVNRMVPRPTERLAPMIRAFCRERILWDYLEDGKLLVRLNQVMRRLGLAGLPEDFVALLPEARGLVAANRAALLDGIPTQPLAA